MGRILGRLQVSQFSWSSLIAGWLLQCRAQASLPPSSTFAFFFQTELPAHRYSKVHAYIEYQNENTPPGWRGGFAKLPATRPYTSARTWDFGALEADVQYNKASRVINKREIPILWYRAFQYQTSAADQ